MNYKSINKKLKKLKVKEAWSKVMKKGNLWYLAVGILVGSSFGVLINSLANDVIMQAIAKAFNFKGVNYMSAGTTSWEWVKDGTGNLIRDLPRNGIMYGKLISALLSFFIIVVSLVFVTWMFILLWSKFKVKKEIESPTLIKTKDELIIEQLKLINLKLEKDETLVRKLKKSNKNTKK